ncbi:aldehyde dehydrogenase family protein [Pseudomonas guariconensis]|uniref:aldehyde dehydrogenase family protein n=1 Tax=Pseudomonas TaxID=286 RepID=UPI002096B121|nr:MULTISPECIES: aldehyde dehydrogenase family protein [Pseudomonas]MCO7641166.1 aldehyde dehydrogenase family protein [Pseudomonas sp. S 311-6]MCO7515449.1 aldehyde dehydrogenase family protein [Pseudomonas putida]MCO7566477.1 aldehyde dehydrogenase family protein [Pseudomonas mosselii]MCO7596541.1 aldehyde dehydrogenase family protein [Pseudomonas guariconensis]MCO7605464.1 aldehyde dehydrogenase family protein [Pseudomonas guariconensis]
MTSYDQLYINGQWVAPAKGGTFDTLDPSSENVITRVAAATAEDVDLAVKAARQAFDAGPWPQMSGSARTTMRRASICFRP